MKGNIEITCLKKALKPARYAETPLFIRQELYNENRKIAEKFLYEFTSIEIAKTKTNK